MPTDSLRTRIAAAIYDHPNPLSRDECEEVADAVIRELADECRAGCMWKIPDHIEDMTDRQREFITRAYEDTLESTAIAAMRVIDEHNARDRGHWTEGEQ